MKDIDSDELQKRIYSLIENVDKRKDKAKAEAYTVKLTDNYDSTFTYGTNQINKDLNEFTIDENDNKKGE